MTSEELKRKAVATRCAADQVEANRIEASPAVLATVMRQVADLQEAVAQIMDGGPR